MAVQHKTISSVEQLSDVITAIANRVVICGTSNSLSGQYYFEWGDFADLITSDDYLHYLDLIVTEIGCRDEILALDFDRKTGELDCNFGLAYCASYEWCEGDEAVFGCSFDEWVAQPAKPATERMSIHAKAQIAIDEGLVQIETS